MHSEDKGEKAMSDMQIAAANPDSRPATLFADLLAALDATADESVVSTPAVAPAPKLIRCTAELESSQHLSSKIALMWGSSDLDVFIRGLFMDSRDGERRGLPAAVAAELMFLAKTNKVLRALDAVDKLGLSFQEAHRLIDEGDEARLVATQIRAAQPDPLVWASRHQTAADSFWRTLASSNLVIYLMIAAICGILFWIIAR